MQNPLFRVAAVYLIATAAFYASTRVAALGLLGSMGTSAAWMVAIAAFAAILAAMWMLYRAVPLPGMLCCAMSVTILGVAAALDLGAFDSLIGAAAAKELTVHVFMTGVVLLIAAIVLMPSRIVEYFKQVVLPALLGRRNGD